MASASAIEVRIGRGDPSAMALNPGKVLDPTSIGRSGMWRVDGPGVLDVHGYIYYDGKALYVQSADDKQPIMVNKHRVSTAWTEVQAGSTIEVGRAELFYRAPGAADADATIARPMGGDDADSTNPKRPSNPTIMAADPPKKGQAFRPGAGTFANRADDESTRLRPMGDDGPPANSPRPAAGAPAGRPNIGRPMMEAQESTVIAPIEDLSGGRGAGAMGPRPGVSPGMAPGMGMGGAPGMMGGPQMMAPGMRPGMPGQMPGMPGMGAPPGQMGMPGGMPGQMPGQMGMPGGMPGQMPGQMGMPGQPWGVPGGAAAQQTVQQPAANLSPIDKFKADWQNFPPAKKAIMIGCPFIMIAALFLLFDDDGAAQGPAKPAGSSSSVASSSTGSIPVSTAAQMNAGMQGAAGGTGLQGTGGNPAGMQGGSGNPFPGGQTATPDNTGSNPFGTSSATPPPGGKDAGGPPPNGKTGAANASKDDGDAGASAGLPNGAGAPLNMKTRTNERLAADTWAEGNYDLAARMYEELARQHPENPAFAEAATILRQKLDAGAP